MILVIQTNEGVILMSDGMSKLKNEIAAEFGYENYDMLDKGEISARDNGRIGGEMVRRLVEYGKMYLAQQYLQEQEIVDTKPELTLIVNEKQEELYDDLYILQIEKDWKVG